MFYTIEYSCVKWYDAHDIRDIHRNNLPNLVCSVTSLTSFKRLLFEYLFDEY